MRQVFTRRNVLIGLTTAGAAAMGGVIWVTRADAKVELLEFFKRSLPGVTIDNGSAKACIDEYMSKWSRAKFQFVGAAWRTAGVETMSAMSERFDAVARESLTYFLTNSNFFQATDPRKEIIVFAAKPPGTACINPFANLEPPQ
ncbi:MAG: hypothetical protein L0387_29050 [Acidobacteria bacterium]|nr:hypothetical protein [Acidobacteriota bacterium]